MDLFPTLSPLSLEIFYGESGDYVRKPFQKFIPSWSEPALELVFEIIRIIVLGVRRVLI
jgi:hypothetical protein